jgi:DNA primase
MGIPKNSLGIAHCLSCKTTIDIFDAASILEGLPASGPEFVKGNLLYLANMFGLDVPNVELSPEEAKEQDILRAYNHAAQIVRLAKPNKLVADKIKSYRWKSELCSELGIGTVESYNIYMSKMIDFHKYTSKFLEDCDLDNKLIFQPNNIIYSIRDEYGSTVAFSARDLNYEAKRIVYDADREKDPTNPGFKPNKYYNSSAKSGIYKKSKVLYLFDKSKKSPKALLLVEGQPDAVSIYSGGINSVAGICSTSFTKDHLDMIIGNGIKHIIFVLDPDSAGQKATDKFITLIENCKYSDLLVEAIVMPNKMDPDKFIRAHETNELGAQALRQLPRIDSFSWRVTKALEFGEEPLAICNKMFLKILEENNNLVRQKMVDKLAEATGFDKDFMRRELLRLIDQKTIRSEEEKAIIIKDIATSLEKVSKQFVLLFPEPKDL